MNVSRVFMCACSVGPSSGGHSTMKTDVPGSLASAGGGFAPSASLIAPSRKKMLLAADRSASAYFQEDLGDADPEQFGSPFSVQQERAIDACVTEQNAIAIAMDRAGHQRGDDILGKVDGRPDLQPRLVSCPLEGR